MKVSFHKRLAKDFKLLDSKIQRTFEKRIELFSNNPYDVKLNNHPLKGRWQGYRSINISGDFRAIYKIVNEDEVIFTNIGSHSRLYK